jgi:lipopolysaccharide heptosyltransferase II
LGHLDRGTRKPPICKADAGQLFLVMIERVRQTLGSKPASSPTSMDVRQARVPFSLKNQLLKLAEEALRAVVRRRREVASPAAAATFPRRILIAKAGGLGDAVLVRAVAASLKSRHPELELGFLVCRPALHVLPLGIEATVHFFDSQHASVASILKTLFEIRTMRYQAAIDFEQGTALSPAFLAAARIPMRIGGYLSGATDARAAMLTHAVEFREADSMLASFLRLGRVLDPGLSVAVEDLYLPYGVSAKRRAETILREALAEGDRIVAFHLGPLGWGDYRRWPLERFVELANRLRPSCQGLTVILTGSSEESRLAEEFSARYTGKSVNLCGRCSVEETAALLQRCDLLVSPDTGVMHLGAAMGAPTVGLFGPNTPVCWAPVGPRATFLRTNGLPCSPCIDNYRNIRPKECINEVKSACMLEIRVEDVLTAASRVVRDGWLG